MLSKFKFVICSILLTACASPPPTGEYRWVNFPLQKQLDSGDITQEEFNSKRFVTQSECKMEMLKIPIPAPSCTIIPPKDYQSTNPYFVAPAQSPFTKKICDYSAVNLAKENQKEYFSSCMGVKGWQKVWHKYKR